MLLVVDRPDVRSGCVRPPAVQRAGGVECGHAGIDHHHQHDGGEHRHDVRTAAGGGRPRVDRAGYDGVGQRPVSAERRGAGLGGGIGDRVVVPAVVLAEPESDRTLVAVH